jgi:AcrR family transcriptional regulator
MARPKSFDLDTALQRAITLFREKGYAGASTEDLLGAMGIGRQSMYDTFGDKRGLFLAALERYIADSVGEFIRDLEAGRTPLTGLDAALKAFARRAGTSGEGCMGVTATFEFGRSDPEVAALSDASARAQLMSIERQLRSAITAGEVSPNLDIKSAAAFVATCLSGIRVAARGGADVKALQKTADFVLLSLRAQPVAQ